MFCDVSYWIKGRVAPEAGRPNDNRKLTLTQPLPQRRHLVGHQNKNLNRAGLLNWKRKPDDPAPRPAPPRPPKRLPVIQRGRAKACHVSFFLWPLPVRGEALGALAVVPRHSPRVLTMFALLQ